MPSNIVLVTGGSRSGKSEFAENLYHAVDDVAYIATAIITDDEMKERVELHQVRRNPKWSTLEGYKELYKIVEGIKEENILLDCVTVMLTNLMFHEAKDFDHMSQNDIVSLEKDIMEEFEMFINAVKRCNKNIVMVTNEVGYGLVPEYKLGRIFRDIAGRVNCKLASLSHEVYLVACGLPLKLK